MSANKQTIASAKYQEKVGIISKSYKLKKEIVEQFAAACEKAEVSQAAQLTKMMKDFIEQQNKK
ncbi:MAG: chemotaxis protein [bacterium]|nr:chemotaxis protein [bacterium]